SMIAGLNHGKSFEKMLQGLGNEYTELKGDILDSNGALKEMRDVMKDNLHGELENLNSAFEEIMISIGTALLPVIKQLTNWMQKLANWFNGLSDSTKSNIAIFSAITAVVTGLSGAFLLFIGFIPQLISGFTAIVTVAKFIGTAIAAVAGAISWPITLAIAAVIALAVVVYKY